MIGFYVLGVSAARIQANGPLYWTPRSAGCGFLIGLRGAMKLPLGPGYTTLRKKLGLLNMLKIATKRRASLTLENAISYIGANFHSPHLSTHQIAPFKTRSAAKTRPLHSYQMISMPTNLESIVDHLHNFVAVPNALR